MLHDLQCDQMLKLKRAQIFPYVAQKLATAVFTVIGCFPKKFKKSIHIWGNFNYQIMSPITLKIDQSAANLINILLL